MGRAYNVIDADGHILEPLDLWDKYIDPEIPRPRAADRQGRERQGAARHRGARGRRRPARHRPDRRGRCAAGCRRGRHDGVQGRQARRVRPAQAHPRHGCRRHRRRLPLSEPRPVFRRHPRPGARRRDLPRLQPLARRLLQALSRSPVRRRDAAAAVGRPRDRRDALRQARSWASAAALSGRTRTTTR